jgi:hypothetical protein
LSSGSLTADSTTRLAAIMAMVDAAEVPALKRMTVEEIAGEVHCDFDPCDTVCIPWAWLVR